MLIRAPFIFRASADIQILDTGKILKSQDSILQNGSKTISFSKFSVILLLIKIAYRIKVLIFSIFHIFISFFNSRPLIFAHRHARK